MKKFFTLFLTLFVASSVWAYDFEVGRIYYKFDSMSETVAVTNGYYSDNVTIPSSVTYNGKSYSVTSIGEWAFNYCSGLTSVTIPNSVTEIGNFAFYECSGLTSVTISNSVTSIGDCAFSGSGLTSITIPNSVTSIGDAAFYECSGLTSITMPDGLDVSKAQLFVIKDGIQYLILNNKEVKVAHKEEKYIGDVVIPASISALGNTFAVTSIGEYAFSNCSGLTSVTIPNSVTSIGDYAFSYCSSLTSVTIPNSVTEIGNEAFYSCSSLTSVTIPNSVTSIGEEAFSGCRWTSITIPNSVTEIGKGAFSDVDYIIYSGTAEGRPWGADKVYGAKDENFYYEDAEKTIIYKYIGNVSDVVIPNSVTSIGERAFSSCSSLTSITIPNSVTSIGEEAFSGCRWTSITIPNSVTSIGSKAFSWCIGLTSITIPNSVTSVGSEAFYECSGLTSVTIIPNPDIIIGFDAFKYCDNLTSVTINGESNVSNADLYFEKDGLRYRVLNKNTVEVAGSNNSGDIMIPASVTAGNTFAVVGIGNSAFQYRTELTSIVIPNSVTSVGSNAFSGCTKLKDVTCLATTPPDAYANSFENYNGYLHVPCESKEEYDFANCWGSFKHVECIGSETVELTKDEVAVVPDKTEAVFSMPKNENANSYTLTISNNGVTFCTLTFNAQGQLANIDFSTTKSYELKSDVAGFQFTVTGLSTASDYGYSFKALASNKSVLKEYAGSFTTKNEDGTGGSVQGGGEGTLAVEAVSNATAVTIVNRQILVNGEAPAFVVTVSGQKIANANLKAGVYFVNVEGETVGVSVR